MVIPRWPVEFFKLNENKGIKASIINNSHNIWIVNLGAVASYLWIYLIDRYVSSCGTSWRSWLPHNGDSTIKPYFLFFEKMGWSYLLHCIYFILLKWLIRDRYHCSWAHNEALMHVHIIFVLMYYSLGWHDIFVSIHLF